MLTLDILICTINEGIHGVKDILLPPREGVSYIVSWQNAGYSAPVPNELSRADVKVSVIEGRGVSRNRNNLIRLATSDICLFADDDVRYQPESLDAVIETYEGDPSLGVVIFKHANATKPNQWYPDSPIPLSRRTKHNLTITGFDISFRRASVQGKVFFNEHLGLGAPVLQCGEEWAFVIDAMRAGINAWFYPKVVARHDHPTTSDTRLSEPGVIMGLGAEIRYRYNGGTGLLRCILKAWRMRHHAECQGFVHTLRLLLAGYRYIAKELTQICH